MGHLFHGRYIKLVRRKDVSKLCIEERNLRTGEMVLDVTGPDAAPDGISKVSASLGAMD